MYKVFIKFDEIDLRVPYLVESYLNSMLENGYEFVTMVGNLFVFRVITKHTEQPQ